MYECILNQEQRLFSPFNKQKQLFNINNTNAGLSNICPFCAPICLISAWMNLTKRVKRRDGHVAKVNVWSCLVWCHFTSSVSGFMLLFRSFRSTFSSSFSVLLHVRTFQPPHCGWNYKRSASWSAFIHRPGKVGKSDHDSCQLGLLVILFWIILPPYESAPPR